MAFTVMISMKKVEAQSCGGACAVFDSNPKCGSSKCKCVYSIIPFIAGHCDVRSSTDVETDEEHPNLCRSHVECTEKGIGSFCARYLDPDNQFGWCFASYSEAEEYFKIASKYKFTKEFLKLPITA